MCTFPSNMNIQKLNVYRILINNGLFMIRAKRNQQFNSKSKIEGQKVDILQLGSGFCFGWQMFLIVTVLLTYIVCLLVQLSMLVGTCCSWRNIWRRMTSSTVAPAPVNNDQNIQLANVDTLSKVKSNKY